MELKKKWSGGSFKKRARRKKKNNKGSMGKRKERAKISQGQNVFA